MFTRLFVFLVGCFFSVISFATTLDKIVVFGDSLSDNGNLYEYFKHQIPPSPPYFEGRFTNGPVWVEILAKNYYPDDWSGHLLNYAFGGAGVSYSHKDSQEKTVAMFTLSREIDSYLLSHSDKADANSLFVVWIGSNNYLASYKNSETIAYHVNASIRKSLELLVAKGAKQVLVINIPDMGKSPLARLFYAEQKLSLATEAHNKELQKNIEELRVANPEVQWILFDADKAFAKILANPEEYGYVNTTDTCYKSILGISASSNLSIDIASTEPLNKQELVCDGFFFFDPVHPSALTHRLLAETLLQKLEAENINFG